jgi:uncharacterized protein YeaO (DUF488 family)
VRRPLVRSLLCAAVLLPFSARAQSADVPAGPEMARLARALAGDWNTVEILQHGKPVPPGQGRRGTSRVRLTGGGMALVSERHSAGAVGGDLRWFITIWWEPESARYRFLTCFRTAKESGCERRGSGHWEGDDFVNDYEETIRGRRVKMQDRWTEITPRSHTLTALRDSGGGVLTPARRERLPPDRRMSVRIVRLGTSRLPHEGLRIGTVRRPPRGIPKSEFAARDFYDVWLPELAPSEGLVKQAFRARDARSWKAFVRRYRAEMKRPAAARLIALLAALSSHAAFSVGCYCEDASRCHRSVLAALLREGGARFASN